MGNTLITLGSSILNKFSYSTTSDEEEIHVPGTQDDKSGDYVDGDERVIKTVEKIEEYLKPLVFVNFKGQASGKDTDSNEKGETFNIGVLLKVLDSLVRMYPDVQHFHCEDKVFVDILEDIANKRHGDKESVEKCLGILIKDAKQFEKIYRERAAKFPDNPLSEPLHHEDYWGTRQQLLAAKVVCDWLSEDDQHPMDPIFGVLLNPTAGRVGPGDTGWFHDILYDNCGAMAHHSAVHDSFGYMINFHKTGPGYNYMYKSLFKKDNPLAGQISGIDFWEHYIEEIQPKVENSENLIFL